MIYTVTFNPAIDYLVHVEELRLGDVNRLQSEEIYCGGKGINVSLVLRELGIPSRALGFVAGFTGKALEEGVAAQGIETDFVHLEKGCTRINVKLKAGQETELNGRGPELDERAAAQLFAKLDALGDGDVLVLAGSVPDGLPGDVYEKILARLSGKGIRAVVDASGELLMNVLKYKPFLIKPNHHELGGLFGVTLQGYDQVVSYALKLRELGAVNVLVSMAEQGAVLVDAEGLVHRCGVCEGTLRNSVGAGDSMVAGFLAGFLYGSPGGDYDYALRLATAAGAATAFSDGLARAKDIVRLLEQL